MIKNRTAQLVFQTVYCTLGLIGIIASLGIFYINDGVRWDFYVHFTNLSNFFCIGVIFAGLVQTVKKKDNSAVSVCPVLKFIGLLMILLTFLVFNIMLAPDREAYLNFRINSILFHVILPIMYIADWFLFYERKKVKWFYPLLSVLAPLVYVIFVFIRAWICDFNTDVPYLYPYFFLDVGTLGIVGVLKWIGILFAAFIAVGYLFFGLDSIISVKRVQYNNKQSGICLKS